MVLNKVGIMKSRPYLIWLFAAAIFGAYALVMVNWWPYLSNDVVGRYAVMAEEFAAGNWQEAFHVRFPPLFNCLTGLVVMVTGVSGLTACRLVAVGALSLSLVAFYHFVRKIFDEETAWWAVAILAILPMYVTVSGRGTRETVQLLAYSLLTLGLVTHSAWLGLGFFILTTTRVDSIVVGGILLGFYWLYAICRREYAHLIFPTFGYLMGLLVTSWMVYYLSGYFVPIYRLAKLLGGAE